MKEGRHSCSNIGIFTNPFESAKLSLKNGNINIIKKNLAALKKYAEQTHFRTISQSVPDEFISIF
jgi:hypothetical protein